MPLIKSCSKKARDKNISELIKSGKPRAQAIAIAFDVCKQLKKRKK